MTISMHYIGSMELVWCWVDPIVLVDDEEEEGGKKKRRQEMMMRIEIDTMEYRSWQEIMTHRLVIENERRVVQSGCL